MPRQDGFYQGELEPRPGQLGGGGMFWIVEFIEQTGQAFCIHVEARVFHRNLHVLSDRFHGDRNDCAPRRVLDDLQVKDIPELIEATADDGNLGQIGFGIDLQLDGLHLGLGLEVECQPLDLGPQIHILPLDIFGLDFHLVDIQKVVDEFLEPGGTIDDHPQELLLLLADASLDRP
jgi:hypothetical protein